MKLSRIAILSLLLVLAGGVALFLLLFERYSEEVDLGFGDKAQRNPFLAAEQFLDRLDISHRRADNIAALSTLGEDDALFLASSSQLYNSERLWELLDWVENGGQAIVVAHSSGGDNERDLLLQKLGLEVTHGDTDLYFNQQVREVFGEDAGKLRNKTASELMREHNRNLSEAKSDGEDDSEQRAATPEVEEPAAPRNPDIDPDRLINRTSDSGTSYELYFNPRKVFTHEMMGQGTDIDVDGSPLHWVPFQNIPTQSPLVFYERGRGRLTLLTDGEMWHNRRIGEFDHAYFLAHLVGERDLVMITRPRFDSLGTLIKRFALEFFVAGLLAIAAWIANRSRRFGPLVPAPASERRSLVEHIRACGYFYWRQNRGQALFEQARAPLLQKLAGHSANRLTPEKCRQLAETLAARTGLAAGDIFHTLWGDAPHSEDDFTARLRSIQIIEAAL